MVRHTLAIAALLILIESSAEAQKRPKIDSLLVVLPQPKAEASEAVVAAFTAAGLAVSDQTGSLITSDEGTTKDGLGDYSKHRVVRATLLPVGDSTRVLIVGTESLIRREVEEGRKRIDNRAKGNGGKVWAKMVAAAKTLDASQVPAEAEPE